MNENLDLTKILDGCPVGTKFYSSIFGEVSLESISTSDKYPIGIQAYNNFAAQSVCIYYTKEGRYCCAYDGECTLFPSKNQRDWSKFERFWDKPKIEKFDPKTFQSFDKVLVRLSSAYPWECDFFSYIRDASNPDFVKGRPIATVNNVYSIVIPYNEETKHLVGTYNDCLEYYKWWKNP